jgi:hypothetical protein
MEGGKGSVGISSYVLRGTFNDSNTRGFGKNSGGSRETDVQFCKEMTGCFNGASVVLFVDKLDNK